jgi:hypothetical protein
LTRSFKTVPHITMRPLVPAVLALTLVFAAGCSLFHHKKAAQPELPPAAGIEVEFRDRWIDQRARQLMASNAALTQAEATQTAATEFAQQYPYISVPKAKTGH